MAISENEDMLTAGSISLHWGRAKRPTLENSDVRRAQSKWFAVTLGVTMAVNDNTSPDRRYTVYAVVITAVVVVGLGLLFYLRWPEIKSATAIEIGRLAGGIGTFLALVWLVCGNLQQTVRFRATMQTMEAQNESAYRGSLQPIIAFQNICATEWQMLNVGKGTAINVNVFGAGDKHDWDLDNSVRFPAICVGDKIPWPFSSDKGNSLLSTRIPLAEGSPRPAGNRRTRSLRITKTQSSSSSTRSGNSTRKARYVGRMVLLTGAELWCHCWLFQQCFFMASLERMDFEIRCQGIGCFPRLADNAGQVSRGTGNPTH